MIERCELLPLVRDTTSGFTKVSIVVRSAVGAGRFKLDPTPSWDDELVGELAGLGCVDVVDMKGSYRMVSCSIWPRCPSGRAD